AMAPGVPPGASLVFSCDSLQSGDEGVVAASYDAPTPVGFDWFVYIDPLAPHFLDQPDNVTACPGSQVAFSATWNASFPVTYQCQHEGQPIAGQSGSATAGTQQRTLVLTGINALSAGSYRIMVRQSPENGRYRTSNDAILTVNGSTPAISVQPA